uniref:Protein kinase domain-containing protein n=1 Tax=Trieres chinensis TaxID=1514140 RepID=A0A7S2AB22_TRICV|mmetsp:Transcript_9540/g.20197  ORF Transcript_9540/g.20197 Transcript_9540/m.20197 type:complete len:391 (+) Transcript_9540:230-1402(+)|eukprot:CAMPEP_0183299926 /NCGR_PEP_ID=MMETSP0160_2-20130417/6505_1 /TAXON_ID=2839 ORGANISM="Odontella Sinensis, Strain Grunow 1884" /NCGR_SAMPLE_ID=MMETSP0160_2 /ASSEMBLY_ACC=CAM_ASM_000250 /LENGTH=390 /DNA_ID=CAMNT_0025462251 /DNA_START=184 /DNA_END=1356 /DNA_ORIENTATION=-
MADPNWPGGPIGQHATQTHHDTAAAGAAADPIGFLDPIIFPAARDEQYLVSGDDGSLNRGQIYLSRQHQPERAYRYIRRILEIRRNGVVWGEVNVCVVLERDENAEGVVFVEPTEDNFTLVAVKELRIEAVDQYLADGGVEDPRREISAMQAIGDGIHVINCVEALENEEHLFIISPYCNGGDLFSAIHEDRNITGPGLPEMYARQRFREILECLHYLQANNICHGDISVENIMIHNGRCILIDLGCCFRVPTAADGRRVMIRPLQRRIGKHEYMSPEIFFSRFDFDAFAVDLWSVGISLFHMLTGQLLGESPVWAVIHTNLNRYIMNTPHLMNLTQHMNGNSCDLIHRILREPATRITLAEVIMSVWAAYLLIPQVPMSQYLQAVIDQQ